MKKKDNIIYIITVIFSALYIVFGNKFATANRVDYGTTRTTGTPQKVRVTQVVDPEYEKVVYEGFETGDKIILFEAEYLKGFRKGDKFLAIQSIDSMYAIDMRVVQPGIRL